MLPFLLLSCAYEQVSSLLVSYGADPHASTPWGSALSVADRKVGRKTKPCNPLCLVSTNTRLHILFVCFPVFCCFAPLPFPPFSFPTLGPPRGGPHVTGVQQSPTPPQPGASSQQQHLLFFVESQAFVDFVLQQGPHRINGGFEWESTSAMPVRSHAALLVSMNSVQRP